MKKLITIIALLIIVSECFSQIDTILNYKGKKLYYTNYPLLNTAGKYFNAFGNFVTLADTVRTYISLTTTGSGAATYNSSTGVFNIPTPSATVGWALVGNASTSPGTDFLGTTDAQNLLVKTNSIIRASYGSDGRSFIDSVYIGRGHGTVLSRTTNLVVGDSALLRNLTGAQNTAFGMLALARDSSTDGVNGSKNSAFGFQALWKNTTGSNNTALGYTSLSTNTTGGSNVAIGYNAMLSNTTGNANVAIGFEALMSNTTAGDATNMNAAVGYKALTLNTTGHSNTAMGGSALRNNVTGIANTAVGFIALTNATGNWNTGIGDYALQGVTSGIQNTGLGEAAGYQITTGNYNTRVGVEYYGVTGVTTGSGNTIIGSNIPLTGASALTNTLILGSGEPTGGANIRLYSNSSKQTGINHITPSAFLHLTAGEATVGKAPLKFTYISLATTATSGTTSIVTLTFAAQTVPPFMLGSVITVAGVTPSGYNGTWTVTGCTTTTVTYSSGTTGAQTVAGTITAGVLLATPEAGTVEYDGTHFYGTIGSTRYQLDQQSGGVAWGAITGTLSDQTDLNTALGLKAPLASPTFTGTVTIPTPFTLGATSVTATGTELNYSAGVTSAIQTQFSGKAALATANIFTTNGALSTPSILMNGTAITGGTGTTTWPLSLIQPSGTTSTIWSTAGTYLGINGVSGFTGNLFDVQLNGAARFKIASTGAITTNSSITMTGDIITAGAIYRSTNNGILNIYSDGSGGAILAIYGSAHATLPSRIKFTVPNGMGIGTDPTSTLHVNGSFSAGYVAKTGTYTATISDYTIECTSGTFTVTLPTAVGITGRIYNVVNSGAGTITVGTTSSQTFVNVVATPTTLTMAAVGSVMVQSNGANWMQLK